MAKVVFIEDEPALQKTVSEFLGVQGYEVVTASNGEEGLELVKSERPDVVLLDLILPKLGGLEVLRRMRSTPELSSVPVIVLTNVESSESVEEAVRLGAKAYLIKTNYTLDEVLGKIRKVLDEAS